MLTIPFLGTKQKEYYQLMRLFLEIKEKRRPKGRRNVVPPSFIYDKKES